MKKLTLILSLASSIFAKGQANFKCITSFTPAASIPASTACAISSQSNGDNSSNLYIPTASMPTLQYKVNFVILLHPTITTKFTGVPLSQIVADANTSITYMNNRLQIIGSIPSNITPINPSPLVANSKLQLVLNNVYTVTTTQAVSNQFGGSEPFASFPFDSASALNYYVYTDNTICGAAWAKPLKGWAAQAECIGNTYTPGGILFGELALHELCHVIGNLQDHYVPTQTVIPTTASQTFVTSSYISKNLDPLQYLYFPDDATWDEVESYPCSIPTNSSTPYYSNNNYMANSPCREYLSARQIASFHYLVANNKTKKYTQFNGMPYPYTPAAPVSNTYTLTGTQTLSTLPTQFSTITIPAGANITITNTIITAAQNGKIIIEPTAKLTLNCVRIETFSKNILWEGIEVWGDATLPQILGSNNLPFNQGMLELNNSTIKDAIVGVTIGKKIAGGIDLTTTGGIIQSTSSSFYNNQIGVDMYPYASYKRGNRKPDISFFIESSFTIDDYYKGVGVIQAPYAFIRTEDVYGLNVLGCNFTGDDYMVGIYALNSRIIVKDYCANPISPTNCGSTPTQNVFSKLGKAIYLINTISTNYSTIDHALFHNTNYKNNAQIYVNKVNNVELINNGMDVDGSNLITQPNYGIYLNNCDAYIVENNVFQASPALKNVGIYVNNSGPNANSIYNNTFTELAQGLWAVNQNYDPTTGNGLVMNCNDFLYGNYNIGIQRTSRNVVGYPNNTGVNTTQGIANIGVQFNVRNTYNVNACNTNAENKYYIGTSNTFAITSHGSFLGNQYHPTPQTSNSCSNAGEITDIVGSTGPPLAKSAYCPVNNLGGFSSRMIADALSTNRSNASTTSASIAAQLDGGNTQTLLNAINGNTGPGNLKNMLMAPAYLSDTVLLAYFGKANMPPNGHIKDVFEKNAPTTNTVWQLVQSLNLPNGIFNQMQAAQNQNKLSNRTKMQSQLQLAQREIGLLNNQKIRRFINDTAGVQYDSIIAIYNLNELPNSKFDKVAINIAAKRFAVAQNQIKELTPQYPDFCAVQQYALNLAQNANYIKDMKLNPSAKNYLIAEVNKANYLTEGLAASILAQVYNIRFDEERLEPIAPQAGARLLNNQTAIDNDVISLANGINVYPNPANDVLNVSFDNQTQNTYTIKIVDVTAKVLIEQNCNSSCTIKLNTLQNGIYFVNLYNGNALLSTKKIVVIK